MRADSTDDAAAPDCSGRAGCGSDLDVYVLAMAIGNESVLAVASGTGSAIAAASRDCGGSVILTVIVTMIGVHGAVT